MTTPEPTDAQKNVLFNAAPWILATACTLLLLLLTLFSVSNYQREKELITEGLAQKGLTLMRFVNSSVRVSIRENLRSGQPLVSWDDLMLIAMEQAAEQPGVEFILLTDQNGNILSGAGKNLPSQNIGSEALEFVDRLADKSGEPFVIRMMRSGQGNEKKFQIASWYLPPEFGGRMHPMMEPGPRQRPMMRGFSHHPQFGAVQAEIARLASLRAAYIVQLDFEQFNSPLRRQLLQIIILLTALLLVIAGGALSYSTLKGLKGSQLRLGNIRAFTDILISALPVGLIATDSSGVVQVFNETAGKILHLEPSSALGKSPADSVPTPLHEMFCGNTSTSMADRQQEVLFSPEADSSNTLHLTAMVVLDDNGDFAGEVLLIRDLTEVRALEKELQRTERLVALGKMAAGVAHELRNPLSSIKGLAVILKRQFPATSKEAETADVLVSEVERLNRSIGEMLDYAKPAQLNRQPTPLGEFIRKTLSLIEVDTRSLGITLRLENEADLPEPSIDHDKMQQVLLNLFLNAIEAMEKGGELVVSTTRNHHNVVIAIEDSGVGIAAENLSRVFDPYFTTKSDGTGLGLALSTKIIEEHDGNIEIDSVPGRGTRVKIILPC
ncbi:MAG: two-component system sensor histidine kinase NtrB [Desulforhopalus sp.]